MSDESFEIAKLKAALATLNDRIRAERNGEVRHALQRGRLEAERAELLVKLMDAGIAEKPDRPGNGDDGSIHQIRPTPFRPSWDEAAASLEVAKGEIRAIPFRPFDPTTLPQRGDKLPGVVVSAASRRKPAGTPTVKAMVIAAFRDGNGTELRSRQILEFIRRTWWKDAGCHVIGNMIYKMRSAGELERGATGTYRLNGHSVSGNP